MKLPEKIKGRHRIRDGAIVLFFKRDALDFIELAEKFHLTERRIRQILAVNHAFVKRDKEWEKEKRINQINRWIKDNPTTKKDSADLLDQLRIEIEGNKLEHSGPGGESLRPITIIYEFNGRENTNNKDLYPEESARSTSESQFPI